MWSVYFIYKERTLKPIKIILSKGMRENDGGNELNQGTM
jgi:hypothetical protein